MNDVDPTTMTLSEIYQQPDSYFEVAHQGAEIPRLGIRYVRYRGAVLRENGTKIFTIKEDDRWNSDLGGHSNYCEVCRDPAEGSFWTYFNKLGPYFYEEHTGYVRPHP